MANKLSVLSSPYPLCDSGARRISFHSWALLPAACQSSHAGKQSSLCTFPAHCNKPLIISPANQSPLPQDELTLALHTFRIWLAEDINRQWRASEAVPFQTPPRCPLLAGAGSVDSGLCGTNERTDKLTRRALSSFWEAVVKCGIACN